MAEQDFFQGQFQIPNSYLIRSIKIVKLFYKQKWRVKVTVSWDVTLCGLAERYQCFAERCRLHL
jgi:hypothetical protein